MQKISIEMPVVTDCSVLACAYNTESTCKARAITVGDKVHPDCDTYFSSTGSSDHAKGRSLQAGVGACKMSNCQHNEDYECVAEKISVGQVMNRINCLTFSQRPN